MAAFGKVVGLPLDIRHITFASAQFGAALATLKFQVTPELVGIIFASVFAMGLINLAVSFSLTLFVAIKSRRIRFAQTPELLGLLGEHFRKRPGDFFFPQGDAE
jgi:site-specific recombinase